MLSGQWACRKLQPHHLADDTIRHFYRTDQNQKVEDQLSHIRPYLCHRSRRGINGRRRGGKQGENDAGQNNDRPLQTNGGIGFDKALADLPARFPGKGGKRHRRNRRVDIQLKKASVYGENHNKGQDGDE